MGRRKTPYDPAAVAYAIEAHEAGRGFRDIATELAELGVSVSHMQIKRWCDASKAPPAVATPPAKGGDEGAADAESSPAPPPPVGSTVDPRLAARLEAQRARAAAAPAPESPPDPLAPFDYEAELQRMIRAAQTEVAEYPASSNPKAAQAAARRASDLMKVLAQSEKRKPADPDVLTFSRAEIERAFGELEAVLQQLCARPVLCSECSRALSVRWGRGQG